eukprot:6209432-Pleurochrysis_carterae.AAC.1
MRSAAWSSSSLVSMVRAALLRAREAAAARLPPRPLAWDWRPLLSPPRAGADGRAAAGAVAAAAAAAVARRCCAAPLALACAICKPYTQQT